MVWLTTTILAGCVEPSERDDPADAPLDAPDEQVMAVLQALALGRGVTFETDHGTIRMLLYEPWLPQTTSRFVELVESGFYDNTLIHRVVDDFVIQGGDPSGTGQLGSGETIPFEDHPLLRFTHGSLGLARDVDPDSGDSQWFIAEKPQPHLSDPSGTTGRVFGTYALYGQVYEGMDIVRAIAAVPTIPGADRPVADVTLQTATVEEPPALDLLAYPLALSSHSATDYAADLVTPTLMFVDRPAHVSLFMETSNDAPAPVEIVLNARSTSSEVNVTLSPHPDDPLMFEGNLVLATAGTWTLGFPLGSQTPSQEVLVTPWHHDYAAYDRSPPPA